MTLDYQAQVQDPFSYLDPFEFVLLTTFRKDGRGVPTTVWFAHADGKLYITTQSTTGKIKRVRNNAHVLLAPCDRIGKQILGKEIEARARELPRDEHQRAYDALAAKYGEMFASITSQVERANTRTYIEVSPV